MIYVICVIVGVVLALLVLHVLLSREVDRVGKTTQGALQQHGRNVRDHVHRTEAMLDAMRAELRSLKQDSARCQEDLDPFLVETLIKNVRRFAEGKYANIQPVQRLVNTMWGSRAYADVLNRQVVLKALHETISTLMSDFRPKLGATDRAELHSMFTRMAEHMALGKTGPVFPEAEEDPSNGIR